VHEEAAKASESKTSTEVNEDDEEGDLEDNGFVDAASDTEEEHETPKKKPTSIPDIEEEMATMKIGKPSSSSDPFNLSFRFPYIQYTYIADGRRYVSVDFLVPGMSKDHFRPKIEGTDLVLHVVTPDFFVNENRLKLAHGGDDDFNGNTNKSTAFQEIAGKIISDHGSELMGDPQRVKLPFPVEEKIADWELLAFTNPDQAVMDAIQSEAFFWVLSVDVVGLVKVKKAKKKGGFRVFGSPA
jgi:hypothetical protein